MNDKWINRSDLLKEIKSVKPKESDWRKDNFEGYSLQEIRNRAALNVYNDILYVIEKAQSSNVAPADHGHWIYGEDESGQDGYSCSECDFFVPWYYKYYEQGLHFIKDYHLCPFCGAKMESEEEE